MGAVKAPTISKEPKISRPIGRPGQAADGPFPRQEPLAGLSSAVTGPGRRLNHRSDGVLGPERAKPPAGKPYQTARSLDWILFTPAAIMSAQALASDPPTSMPRQASSTT